jgi:hypothetical protein
MSEEEKEAIQKIINLLKKKKYTKEELKRIIEDEFDANHRT